MFVIFYVWKIWLISLVYFIKWIRRTREWTRPLRSHNVQQKQIWSARLLTHLDVLFLSMNVVCVPQSPSHWKGQSQEQTQHGGLTIASAHFSMLSLFQTMQNSNWVEKDDDKYVDENKEGKEKDEEERSHKHVFFNNLITSTNNLILN